MKTLSERIYELLTIYGGLQVDKDRKEINFKDGLGLILNYLNLEDEVMRLEKKEIENIELKACLDFANEQIKELKAKLEVK